jgi:excisionase family DNA binding protein
MIQTQVIFSGASKEDFLNDLRAIVREEITAFTPPQSTPKKYLTLPEASEFLGLSKSTLYRMTSEKEIPHIKRGKILFDSQELATWLKQSAQPEARQIHIR